MKRILAFFFALCICLLSACSGSGNYSNSKEHLSVTFPDKAQIFDLSDLSRYQKDNDLLNKYSLTYSDLLDLVNQQNTICFVKADDLSYVYQLTATTNQTASEIYALTEDDSAGVNQDIIDKLTENFAKNDLTVQNSSVFTQNGTVFIRLDMGTAQFLFTICNGRQYSLAFYGSDTSSSTLDKANACFSSFRFTKIIDPNAADSSVIILTCILSVLGIAVIAAAIILIVKLKKRAERRAGEKYKPVFKDDLKDR